MAHPFSGNSQPPPFSTTNITDIATQLHWVRHGSDSSVLTVGYCSPTAGCLSDQSVGPVALTSLIINTEFLVDSAGINDAGRFVVIEVWDTPEHQAQFMEGRLGEALAKGGVEGPPASITWIELVAHHHLGK
jgi:hypothetical protein